MLRRKRISEASHDRWLISYADFITLLFAFFVVLFASSHADRVKAKRASEAVKKAFGEEKVQAEIPKPASRVSVSPNSLEPVLDVLVQGLQPEIKSGKMQVRMEKRGIVVSLSQASFFPSGEDSVDPAMIGSLAKVAAAVASLPNLIRLEGHTDSVPIHTPRFRSNWDLSSARAIAMMELLHDQWHLSAGRLAVTGYGDTVPIESNASESGRAHNRRVDLVILNSSGETLEPKGTL